MNLSPELKEAIARIQAKIMPLIAREDPTVTTMALLVTAAACAQGTEYKPEHLAAILTATYHQTQEQMKALGLKPGEPPPADFVAKARAMLKQAGVPIPDLGEPPK